MRSKSLITFAFGQNTIATMQKPAAMYASGDSGNITQILIKRAEKSEVLSEELQVIERRVEQVKQAYKNTHTRLATCMQGQGLEADKRKRKMPEMMLSQSMLESATLLGLDTLLGKMFNLCGDANNKIAHEHLVYEMAVENNVLMKINQILEMDIPTILKLRKQLSKVTLDMDSAKTRYHSASKQTNPGNSAASKVETIREEMEDAEQKVEQLKDQVATDMYHFVSQEAEYSKLLLDLIQSQADYHRRSLEALEQILPAMQEESDHAVQIPIYGHPLEDHLLRQHRDISMVIEDCVLTLKEIGMEEEGLFRVTGSASKIKRLKASFDAGMVDMADYVHDIHCVAAALKQYLRELPEPLMTYQLHDDWMHAAHLAQDQRLQAYWLVLDKMPKANYNNLRYLIKFLAKLAEMQDINKMSASNIAIVMGPNLLWPPGDGGPSVLATGVQSSIVESLITHADWFFPGDFDFHKTGEGMCSPVPQGKRLTAPPPPANHLVNRPRPKSVHAINLNAAASPIHSTLAAPVSHHPPGSREGSPNCKTTAPNSGSSSPKLNTSSSSSLGSLARQNSLTSSLSKSYDTKGKEGSISQTTHSDSHLDSSKNELLRKDLAQRYSWNERPLMIQEAESGPVLYKSLTTSGSSVSPLTTSDSFSSAKLNGDNGRRISVEHDGISDTTSEPGTLTRSSIRRERPARAITPPPKPPPPRGMHGDVYNTVFALQSLGDGAWSDYLTRVRTLMDGHMSKSYSSPPSTGAHAGLGSSTNGASPEVDFSMTASGSSTSSLTLIPNCNSENDTAPLSTSADPLTVSTTGASLNIQGSASPGTISSPTHSQSALNTISTSTGNLPESSDRVSPKMQRRPTRKPPAPLPPMPPDRHSNQEKAPILEVASEENLAPSVTVSPPEELRVQDRNSLERGSTLERPPLPDRPSAHPHEKPDKHPSSPRHERPRGPPPDRPTGPPPEKPEKPEKPFMGHVRSSSNPPLPSAGMTQRQTSHPGKPDRPEKPEKPGIPPPPSASFQRQGSGRPPRPQPPPPLTAERRTSHEMKAPLAEQEPVTPTLKAESAEATHL